MVEADISEDREVHALLLKTHVSKLGRKTVGLSAPSLLSVPFPATVASVEVTLASHQNLEKIIL